MIDTPRAVCQHLGCWHETYAGQPLCLVCQGGNDRLTCGAEPRLRPPSVPEAAQAITDFAALRADALALCDVVRSYVGYPGAGRDRATLEQVMAVERAVRERWQETR